MKERSAKKEQYKGIDISRVKYTEFNNKSKIGRIANFSRFYGYFIKVSKSI